MFHRQGSIRPGGDHRGSIFDRVSSVDSGSKCEGHRRGSRKPSGDRRASVLDKLVSVESDSKPIHHSSRKPSADRRGSVLNRLVSVESGSKHESTRSADQKGSVLERIISVDGSTIREETDSMLSGEMVPMELDLTPWEPESEDSESDSHVETRKEKFTRLAKTILPHFGLVILLTCYTLGGAITFYLLEWPHETQVRKHDLGVIINLRQTLTDGLWKLSQRNVTSIDEEDFRQAAETYFNDLASAMYQAYSNQYTTDADVRNDTGTRASWTIPNSIFFATAVLTTIGYGNVVPRTFYGRVLCIVFALFGIPLLLVTIADLGKFLSEFLGFVYSNYRSCIREIRRHSRRVSFFIRRSSSTQSVTTLHEDNLLNDSDSDLSSNDELHIPVVLIWLVLLSYTAIGGLLFRYLEGWPYLDALYFSFITMSTVGFGDIVPTKQVYMLITMAYIIFGLALATMCIDLAGTEYIRKIHYLGHKMDEAKDVVGDALVSGVHAGEHLIMEGREDLVRIGDKLVHIGDEMLSSSTSSDSRDIKSLQRFAIDRRRNILYEPASAAVQRQAMKARIKLMPNQISEKEGFILQNKSAEKPLMISSMQSPNAIHTKFISRSWPRSPADEPIVLVAPFVMKESDV